MYAADKIRKRTAAEAVKTAVNMARKASLTARKLVLRVDPAQLDQLLHRRVDPSAKPMPCQRAACFSGSRFRENCV